MDVYPFVFGCISIVAGILTFKFRVRIAKVEAWFHREAPGGGGEKVSRYATVRSVVVTALFAVALGAWSVVRAFGLVG
ncbi:MULTISPECIES: hypothetical protein [unclassified Leucobacter]|uniref:hypothetical protein n=1 Tax=unclassified Leucobacter TaxID=2621730 RepID=UPI000622777C|nr:hypothetical protein [Leucobacter sp. Ag1]KKI22628.1 hypothetical protein XM48_00815 [Leucobacter sp. Ag1]